MDFQLQTCLFIIVVVIIFLYKMRYANSNNQFKSCSIISNSIPFFQHFLHLTHPYVILFFELINSIHLCIFWIYFRGIWCLAITQQHSKLLIFDIFVALSVVWNYICKYRNCCQIKAKPTKSFDCNENKLKGKFIKNTLHSITFGDINSSLRLNNSFCMMIQWHKSVE